MVITGTQVYTTISDEKFTAIRARISALRRMKLETLLALCKKYYDDFHTEYMNNKGDTFQYILQAEFGWQTMEAYNNEVEKRERARMASTRRGQLTLGI